MWRKPVLYLCVPPRCITRSSRVNRVLRLRKRELTLKLDMELIRVGQMGSVVFRSSGMASKRANCFRTPTPLHPPMTAARPQPSAIIFSWQRCAKRSGNYPACHCRRLRLSDKKTPSRQEALWIRSRPYCRTITSQARDAGKSPCSTDHRHPCIAAARLCLQQSGREGAALWYRTVRQGTLDRA